MANILADILFQRFPEVSPYDFYRDVFPDNELESEGEYVTGKYTGIALEITNRKRTVHKKYKDGSVRDIEVPVVRRYSVTDDLNIIDELTYPNGSDGFCLIAPISYAGKTRESSNARFLYALCVEIDNLRVNKEGKQVGLNDLVHQCFSGHLPTPTYLVASGNGIHVYYLFQRPIPLFKNVTKSLSEFKAILTRKLWNSYVTFDYEDDKIQQESLFQGFRMVGTLTKKGDICRAFKVGERVTMEYMASFTYPDGTGHWFTPEVDFTYKSDLLLADAKEKYPEWYQNRIVDGKPKGRWTANRAVYDWWLNRISKEVEVGHRYYCLTMLAVYAIKCDISYDELSDDMFSLVAPYEELTDSDDNHFTDKDVMDALQMFEDKGYVTYPINSISYKSGLPIKKNKRNYRKQYVHMAVARHTLAALNETGGKILQGRHTAESEVWTWRKLHPKGTKSECIRDTGFDNKTVYKWWDKGFEPEKSSEQKVADWRDLHPDGTKADCIKDTGLSKPTVYKLWDKSTDKSADKHITLIEMLVERVEQEYNDFVTALKAESVDVIIKSAYEVITKDKIRTYIGEEQLNLSDEQINALLSSTNILSKLYDEWNNNNKINKSDNIATLLEYTSNKSKT